MGQFLFPALIFGRVRRTMENANWMGKLGSPGQPPGLHINQQTALGGGNVHHPGELSAVQSKIKTDRKNPTVSISGAEWEGKQHKG